MSYLLDTHILLWAMDEFEKLTQAQIDIIQSDDRLLVSVATIWEMSIKASLGKLEIPDNIANAILDMGYVILPIEPAHAEATRNLPLLHRDPFDRMLVAQAQIEGLSILTTDKNIMRYDVTCI